MAIVDDFPGIAAAVRALRAPNKEARIIPLTGHTLSQEARITLRDFRIEAAIDASAYKAALGKMQKIYGRVSPFRDASVKNTIDLVYQTSAEPAVDLIIPPV